MYTITGAFNDSRNAESAIQALYDSGFALDHGPAHDADQDQASPAHAAFDVSPEPSTSPGAEQAPQQAAAGVMVGSALGFIAGLGALPVLGPAAPLAGAGVGAYGGSLLGALKGMKPAEGPVADAARDDATDAEDSAHIERGEGGVITIVAHDGIGRAKAVDILWSCGAVTVVEGE